MNSDRPSSESGDPRLLDRFRQALVLRHYSPRTVLFVTPAYAMGSARATTNLR
jgi:hypothetical protein